MGQEKDKFEVEVWEKGNVVGGVATSVKIDDKGLFINDGVQGGAPSYRNTILLHKVIFTFSHHLIDFFFLMIKYNMIKKNF